jgi:signal transduction histidine kinase
MNRHVSTRALLAGGFVVGYLLLDWVSYIHPLQQYNITPWNPQPALAIALLMLGGQGWLPLIFVAVLGAELLTHRSPLSGTTLVVSAVLALAYAAIARTLHGRFAVSPALDSRRDVMRLLGVVAIGALVTGILYIGALVAGGTGPLEWPFEALARFFIGDAVGIMVTLPFVLMVTVPRRRAEMIDIAHRPETLAHAAATAAAVAIVLAGAAQTSSYFYVLFLPLVAIAIRFGLVGATLATLAIQGTLIAAGALAGMQSFTVLEFQALLIALAVTGLFLGVSVDERERAERELRESLRLAAAGEMAAALAHELNQPLTALATYARASQVLAREGDSARLEETLAKLAGEAGRAADVVRRLRDFFRTGATQLAPVAMESLAERVAAGLEPRAVSMGVTIRRDLAAALPPLLADELQLEVVMRNLLMNAIQAASEARGERRVDLSVEHDGEGAVRTTVRDSGAGVREADAQRIFQPFETTRPSGMGMGLAISRAIVEAHGGRLWARPGPRGEFSFTLPVAL